MMLLAGVVLAAECALLLFFTSPIALKSHATISNELLILLLVQMMILGIALVLYSLMRKTKLISFLAEHPWMGQVPMIVGIVLSIEGLAVINIFNLVVDGTLSLMAIMMGIQLFCLGLLSMTVFVVEHGTGSYFIRGTPTLNVILFFILLLPAAFLIIN